jgi:hypothetical protein
MAKTYRQPSKPTPKPCPKCKRLVLAGWDGRAAALAVVIDAETLTRDGELVNIVNGVKMYATNTQGDILRRTAGEVLHHGNHLDMHREHDCEKKTPPVFIKPAPIKPPRVTNDKEVPF